MIGQYFIMCSTAYFKLMIYFQKFLIKATVEVSDVPLHKKMNISIKDFFSKCDQIRRKLRIWSYILKKFLMENFIFCTVFFGSNEIMIVGKLRVNLLDYNFFENIFSILPWSDPKVP